MSKNPRHISGYSVSRLPLTLFALTTLTMIGCSGSLGLGGGHGQIINDAASNSNTSNILTDVDVAQLLSHNSSPAPVITAEMLQKTLDSIKTADDPDGAKFFAKTAKLPMQMFLDYIVSNLNNDPVEILGYPFENLRDTALAVEGEMQKIADHYPTLGDYREASGVHSLHDIHLEKVENFVASVSENFNQQASAGADSNQSVASFFELHEGAKLNLFIGEDWAMLPARILGACGPAMFGVAGTQMAGQGNPAAGTVAGQANPAARGALGLRGILWPDGEDIGNIFAANCQAMGSTMAAAKQAGAGGAMPGGAAGPGGG